MSQNSLSDGLGGGGKKRCKKKHHGTLGTKELTPTALAQHRNQRGPSKQPCNFQALYIMVQDVGKCGNIPRLRRPKTLLKLHEHLNGPPKWTARGWFWGTLGEKGPSMVHIDWSLDIALKPWVQAKRFEFNEAYKWIGKKCWPQN